MPDVLSQLGIDTNLTSPAGGEAGISQEGYANNAIPVTEAENPAMLGSSKEIAETILAGAIIALEQVVSIYGYTTEEGKKIARAIDSLSSVVPEGKIKEVQGQLRNLINTGGMMPEMPMGAPAMPAEGGAPMPPPAG